MKRTHQRNSVRYYLLLIALFIALFFIGDFGTLDTQKTAIVMAVGVDRREDTFIVTSQIAIPQSSKQGKASETVQLVSRGKTVADAFADINAKTGWYPKLVFCNLIILGENTAKENVFDALEFFLLNEYLSDGCLLATCDGLAKDLLNVTALVDPSGSVAMQKILSEHANRVGTVLPTTLREFAVGYYGESASGYMPVIQTKPQQEEQSETNVTTGAGEENSSQQGGGQDKSAGNTDKPVFSAEETALFLHGKRVETLSKEETFAVNCVKNKLRLAGYSVPHQEEFCTLSIKDNATKTKLSVSKDGRAGYEISITLSAGLADRSSARKIYKTKDLGDVPDGVFSSAEKRLASQIESTFEKCKNAGCDLFEIRDTLQKFHPDKQDFSATVLQNTTVKTRVKFRNVR